MRLTNPFVMHYLGDRPTKALERLCDVASMCGDGETRIDLLFFNPAFLHDLRVLGVAVLYRRDSGEVVPVYRAADPRFEDAYLTAEFCRLARERGVVEAVQRCVYRNRFMAELIRILDSRCVDVDGFRAAMVEVVKRLFGRNMIPNEVFSRLLARVASTSWYVIVRSVKVYRAVMPTIFSYDRSSGDVRICVRSLT